MEYNVNSKGGLATKGQNCLDHVNACNLFDAGKNSNSHLGDYTPHIESSLFLLFYFVFDLRKFPPKTWIRCQNLNIKIFHRKKSGFANFFEKLDDLKTPRQNLSWR